eukprot:TRINITY_DN2732_c1_g2_i1.p1 TRINITY_DN2732_c1_g2~~TRINITY_DN2732_c1_g2_i1.p1  ORF type:complete len:259 (-),score=61.87 TRINITY_DN2732_c1_g2_i1:190-966(-)
MAGACEIALSRFHMAAMFRGSLRPRQVGISPHARTPFALSHVRTFFGGLMKGEKKEHKQSAVFRYPASLVASVVSDVPRYSEFLPWCTRSAITRKISDSHYEAELAIGFGGVDVAYTSNVFLSPTGVMATVKGEDAMFEHLDNTWTFTPVPRKGGDSAHADPNKNNTKNNKNNISSDGNSGGGSGNNSSRKDTGAPTLVEDGWCHVDFNLSYQFRSALYSQMASSHFQSVAESILESFQLRCQEVHNEQKVREEMNNR